jgi:nicotinamide mononucleotide transporter
MPRKYSKKQKRRFNLLDYFCIGASIVLSIAIALFYHENPPFYTAMSIVALICGVVDTILNIKGFRSTYIFAFIEAFACFYTSWTNHFLGNAIINLVFYAPIALFGFYSWGKHRDKNKRVIARRFTTKQAIVTAIVYLVVVMILNAVLTTFGGKLTILDSAATVFVIFAIVLSVLRFREQWIFWFLSDILQLIMWTTTNDPAVLALRIFFPLGAIYGYVNWKTLIGSSSIKRKRKRQK